jgi:rhamnosyltransferase
MMKMKLAACVILYHPDELVSNNITSYLKQIDKIYILDNSEHQAFNIQSLSAFQSKIIFIHNRKNEGIAQRLNQACELAIEDGFDFLLTMDQDSYFDEASIINYLNCIDAFTDKPMVSMFGINYEQQPADTNCTYKKNTVLITSGSMVNLNSYKTIGSFDENLFIDFVDTEYCFRSMKKGYELVEFPNIFMHHSIGKMTQQRSLKNLKSSKRSIHSAIRLYYMARNLFYLNKKYKDQFTEQLRLHKKDLLNRIKNKLFYHSNRYKTLQYLVKAFIDYKSNKMGKQF